MFLHVVRSSMDDHVRGWAILETDLREEDLLLGPADKIFGDMGVCEGDFVQSVEIKQKLADDLLALQHLCRCYSSLGNAYNDTMRGLLEAATRLGSPRQLIVN